MYISIVNGGDWEGIYFDGELQNQGHSLDIEVILEALKGRTITSVDFFDLDDEWMEDQGWLPNNIQDVVVLEDKGEE